MPGKSSNSQFFSRRHLKIGAVFFGIFLLIFWFPLSIIFEEQQIAPYEQVVDQGVDGLDQLDGTHNFTPGSMPGASIGQKTAKAFGVN